MKEKVIKKLDLVKKFRYAIFNIPATPLSFRANAHFGRVFSFILEYHGAI
ncbi:MAG: hypothetical protein ISS45_07105 [Candidatus Omnitrophica bacterium]|nr:hypothetical protein [Candidatus Omnitrophota bacterium]